MSTPQKNRAAKKKLRIRCFGKVSANSTQRSSEFYAPKWCMVKFPSLRCFSMGNLGRQNLHPGSYWNLWAIYNCIIFFIYTLESQHRYQRRIGKCISFQIIMAISDIYVKFRAVSYPNLGKNRTILLVLLQILGKSQSDSNSFQRW